MASEEPTRTVRPPSPRRGISLWALLALLLAAFGAGGSPCAAHPASIAAATAKVQPGGHFSVEARFDLLAFVLDDTPQRIGDPPMNALLDGPASDLQAHLAEAEGRFRRDFQVSGGSGPGVVDAVVFPGLTDVQKWRDSGIKPRLPVTMTVTVQGHLPPGAGSVSFRFPNVLGMIVVTTEFPYREPVSEPVEAGAFSTPLPLSAALPAPVSATRTVPAARAIPVARKATAPKPERVAAAVPAPKTTPKAVPSLQPPPVPSPAPPPVEPARAPYLARATPPTSAVRPIPTSVRKPAHTALPLPAGPTEAALPMPAITPSATPAPSATHRLPWIVMVFRYVQMGYTHILPEGLDHILFVLGLFLLSARLKPLLWQITAFTVAHSLTLALSLYGLVRLPPAIIEPVIAASIAFVAVENLFTTELKPWRPFVVFGFGLVHGMGFAGALKDLGLQRHDFLTALVGFNAGVELGQLSVVALALLAVGWFRSRPSYRRLVVIPASATIAAVAVFWTFQRLLA